MELFVLLKLPLTLSTTSLSLSFTVSPNSAMESPRSFPVSRIFFRVSDPLSGANKRPNAPPTAAPTRKPTSTFELLIILSLCSLLYIKNPCQFFTRLNSFHYRLNEQKILHSEQETP